MVRARDVESFFHACEIVGSVGCGLEKRRASTDCILNRVFRELTSLAGVGILRR
jgi:hypothetical protein